jgi:hypothetical protein
MLLLAASTSAFFVQLSLAQAPKGDGPKAAAKAPKAKAAAKAAPQANLGQIMKGVLYINSNVIFAAQSEDPAKIAPAKDSSVSTDALTSTYGKWEAVENSALAMYEGASLLTVPGRVCANGRPVPINAPDWSSLVQGVRDAAMVAYNAAKAKDQDKIVDAADVITTACANCHDKYREKTPRCVP